MIGGNVPGIWHQIGNAEYHDDMVDFPEMMTWPKPVQKPRPPILVGGGFPQAAHRAIRYGDACRRLCDRRIHEHYGRRSSGDPADQRIDLATASGTRSKPI